MPCDPRKGHKTVPPVPFAQYRGLLIFHTYYDGDVRQPQHWWYVLYPCNDPEEKADPWLFDIRDLPNARELDVRKTKSHGYILKDAIDNKLLPDKAWLERVGWKFKLKEAK
jgi:hypothetical protein